MGHDLPDVEVTCVACGDRVERAAAREYDKYGDRWDREGKSFEYLCKPCFRGLIKQHRQGLESLLERAGAGRVADETFLRRFADHVEPDDEDCERRRYD
ncbi:Zn finger protein, C2H2 type [Halanaeroarchaeum sp. HSR-CO]|uniref:DUF7562 family protein n=1 Tax=Halanaeroarchaeum sp. HSR-CO TaxID=2866382 RepID=UPI00217D8A2E|nr:hypothetical protein [Halanaeroarchaeum sp. HSR-CO]UWG46934.1 Zn finger protein, C2H2 type [Halanaeroarchaeum sp. HSR-CO]